MAPMIVKITTVVDNSTLGLTKNCTPDRLVINPNKNKPNKATYANIITTECYKDAITFSFFTTKYIFS